MKTLDKNVFGDSKAAIILAEELNLSHNKIYARKCSRLLCNYGYFLSELSMCEQLNFLVKRTVFELVKKDYMAVVQNSKFPDNIKRLMCNIIVGRFRKLLQTTLIKNQLSEHISKRQKGTGHKTHIRVPLGKPILRGVSE